jgi:hypothetical protein
MWYLDKWCTHSIVMYPLNFIVACGAQNPKALMIAPALPQEFDALDRTRLDITLCHDITSSLMDVSIACGKDGDTEAFHQTCVAQGRRKRGRSKRSSD